MPEVISDEELSSPLLSRTFRRRFGKPCEHRALLTASQGAGGRQALAL